MRKLRTREKLNEKGFSLLELLIAVIVLAIIVVPFLHSFLTSSKMNAKARLKSQATTLAQNTFEGLKTETYLQDADGKYTDVTLPHLGNLAYQFSYPDLNGTNNFYVLPRNVLENAKVGVLANPEGGDMQITKTVDGIGYDFVESTTYRYYFYIWGAKEQGSLYDILVKLDGSPYVSTGSSNQNYNQDTYVKIPYVNTEYDAVSIKNYDEDAKQDISMKVTSQGLTFDEDRQTRSITIDIKKETDLVNVVVTYRYGYQYQDGTSYQGMERSFTAFCGDEKDFRNINLYYYPLYSSTSSKVQDSIVINNNVGGTPYETECFLIKQEKKDDPNFNTSDLRFRESSYRVRVEVNDSELGASGNCATKIRTNIGTSLYQVYQSGNAEMKVLGQGQYYHNKIGPLSDSAATTRFDLQDIIQKESKTAYLNAEVQIYEHSTELPSAVSDFDNRECLVSMDGSIVN